MIAGHVRPCPQFHSVVESSNVPWNGTPSFCSLVIFSTSSVMMASAHSGPPFKQTAPLKSLTTSCRKRGKGAAVHWRARSKTCKPALWDGFPTLLPQNRTSAKRVLEKQQCRMILLYEAPRPRGSGKRREKMGGTHFTQHPIRCCAFGNWQFKSWIASFSNGAGCFYLKEPTQPTNLMYRLCSKLASPSVYDSRSVQVNTTIMKPCIGI